jgi:putative transposase
MPRLPRHNEPQCWYHVINRGINKQNIFFCDSHKLLFLMFLKKSLEKFTGEIHGYCLMDNHYHLLIYNTTCNLSNIMRYLNGSYTRRFNYITGRSGPLFTGRFKSYLITNDKYLLLTSRYIHLNPVKAYLVENAIHYEWSSCKYYTNIQKKPSWLETAYILSMFSKKNPSKRYQEFLELELP